MKQFLYVILGAAFVYLGTIAEFPIPGTDIPQTGQTVAVLCVGMILGVVLGGASVILYLALGVAGLPVFSDSGYGFEHLSGATGGYLWGFLVAACLMGLWKNFSAGKNFSKSFSKKIVVDFAASLLGHMVILACGWIWLANQIGMMSAYQSGVAPFYFGAMAKSIIAALLVCLARIIIKLSIETSGDNP
jgi:biotin transport system substrate-specific component